MVAKQDVDVPLYLRPGKVAELLGTTTAALALDRHRRRGLPYCKLGARVYYPAADIVATLEANRVEPQEAA